MRARELSEHQTGEQLVLRKLFRTILPRMPATRADAARAAKATA